MWWLADPGSHQVPGRVVVVNRAGVGNLPPIATGLHGALIENGLGDRQNNLQTIKSFDTLLIRFSTAVEHVSRNWWL